MSKKITTSDIETALMKRYPSPQFSLLWEVGNGTGSNLKRWADAVSMCLYPSRGLEIEGIEIKVSRSDWLRELENVKKSAPVQKYCDRWWIAAPAKMIDPDELPPTWGLMELLKSGNMRTKKAAPRLEPSPLDRGFIAAVMRRCAEADAAIVDKLVHQEVEAKMKSLRENFELRMSFRQKRLEAAAEKIDAIEAATGLKLDGWEPSEDLIAAIQFGLRYQRGYQSLDTIASQCETLAQKIRGFVNGDQA